MTPAIRLFIYRLTVVVQCFVIISLLTTNRKQRVLIEQQMVFTRKLADDYLGIIRRIGTAETNTARAFTAVTNAQEMLKNREGK